MAEDEAKQKEEKAALAKKKKEEKAAKKADEKAAKEKAKEEAKKKNEVTSIAEVPVWPKGQLPEGDGFAGKYGWGGCVGVER